MEFDKVLRQEMKGPSREKENDDKPVNSKASEAEESLSVDQKYDYYYEHISDGKSIDQTSDISPVYLDCENSDEDNTEDSKDADNSTDGEKHLIDSKDLYMVIVSDKKTSSDAGFHCEICNLTFSTVDEGNKHFTSHKPDTCKKCEICNNITDKNVYDIHMKLHKEAYKQRKLKNKAQCKRCGKFVGKSYLNFHMKMHGTQKDKTERLKQCPICEKQVHYYYFNSHMKRIHGKSEETTDFSVEKAKKCPICDRSFKANLFEKHIASHGHHRKQYICDQCGQIFKQYSAFQTHRLIHVGELKYKCQYCPYRGLHLGLLKVHVRTHTKDYLYECSTCNKKFLTKSNLSIHERRHTAPNTFVCVECKRGFYTKRNLDKHFNLIHLGIRNEKCEICGKAFGHRDGLLSHQNKVHNRERSTYKGRLPSYLKVEQTISMKSKKNVTE